MSNAESEGELEGGEKKGGGGRRCCDRFSCQSAAVCLANRRERRARERGAEGDTERDAGQCCALFWQHYCHLCGSGSCRHAVREWI